MSYAEFLAAKRVVTPAAGFAVDEVHAHLFDFQGHIVRWALERGRAAIFADCGLGKTPMQLEWARHVRERTGRPVLILAPLAVSTQTLAEAEKFGVEVNICRDAGDITDGINITNYERLHHFDRRHFGALVLDESSILKDFYSGKTRKALTEFADEIPYRLACTATPAPNDLLEIANHSEFVGNLGRDELIARYFIADGSGSALRSARLKHHAVTAFYEWMAGWAMALRHPRDLGFTDDSDRFELPPLEVIQHTVGDALVQLDRLFAVEAHGLRDRQRARAESVERRVERCAELVAAEPDERWLIWCGLNSESEALRKAIPGAVEVRGSDSPEHKERALLAFAGGELPALVTKPSIAGHGMNFQGCARMAFVGLSDSWEQYYQAIRRCWRFGQMRPVVAHVITAAAEGPVVRNIERKERQASRMMDAMVDAMGRLRFGRQEEWDEAYEPQVPMVVPEWLYPVRVQREAVAA